MNAMEFFEKSAGQWRSQRTTHHLAFRRAESGTSDIWVESLQAT
ncbi:MAG: phycobiliprotein lyase, partial [Microcystaceae cyanobacterium]